MGSSNAGTLIRLWCQCPEWTASGRWTEWEGCRLHRDSPLPLPPSSSGCCQVTGQPHTSNPPSASSVTVDQWLNLLIGILSFGNDGKIPTSQSHICSVNSSWAPGPCPHLIPDRTPAGDKGCSRWSGSYLGTAPLPSHLCAWSKRKSALFIFRIV